MGKMELKLKNYGENHIIFCGKGEGCRRCWASVCVCKKDERNLIFFSFYTNLM